MNRGKFHAFYLRCHYEGNQESHWVPNHHNEHNDSLEIYTLKSSKAMEIANDLISLTWKAIKFSFEAFDRFNSSLLFRSRVLLEVSRVSPGAT